MPTDEHGSEIDEDFTPESPILRGEARTPDQPIAYTDDDPTAAIPGDELPHRYRRDLGIDNDDPDPGYDPSQDDLL